MDEDGSAESGRTRLARGTKPNAPLTKPERGSASADAAIQAAGEPRVGGDGRVRSAPGAAPASRSVVPPSPDTAHHAVRDDAAAVGSVSACIDARGSGPLAAGGAPGGADRRALAQSIHEAVEQLIEEQEANEAIAEWMQGGG